jgi:hypothetical protein
LAFAKKKERNKREQTTVSRQLPKKGHREVASETLLPIILEVGTLGHILLTDPHGPTSKGLWWQQLSLSFLFSFGQKPKGIE